MEPRTDDAPRSLPEGGGPRGLWAEGVEVAGSAVAAMHPRRLLLGLLLLLLLVETGRTYDRITEPRFGPAGLLAADPAADRATSLEALLASIGSQVARSEESAEVLRAIEAEVRRLGEVASTASDDAARKAAIATLAEIERLRPRGTFEATSAAVAESYGGFVRAVITLRGRDAAESLGRVLFRVPWSIWRHDRMFLIGVGVPSLVLLGIFGGMLARIAACRFARRQWVSVSDAADFAASSALRLVSAPFLPVIAALVPLGVAALLGLLLQVPLVDAVGGIAFGVPLALSLFAAILLLGLLASSLLVIPAVTCEDADAADALQRAYACLFNQPLRLLGLVVVGLISLAIGTAVVDGVVVVMLGLASSSLAVSTPDWVPAAIGSRGWLEFGGGGAKIDLLLAPWSASAISVWCTLARWLVGAYVLAWIFDGGVRIYLFLRQATDGTRPEEIAPARGRVPQGDRIAEAIDAARRAR